MEPLEATIGVEEERGDAVAFARDKLGFVPDAKQEAVPLGGRRGIVNCTRQGGESTVAAAKGGQRAESVGGRMALGITPSRPQGGASVAKKARDVRPLRGTVR